MKVLAKIALVSMATFLMANETNYDPSIDLQEGKNYLKQHNENLAIAAFDRILMYQPNNNTAKLYLAKAFIQLGKIDVAKDYLKQIKNPSKEIQEEINKIYQKYPDRKVKFDLTLLVGMNFDPNINNDTDANSWDIYLPNNQTNQLNNQTNINNQLTTIDNSGTEKQFAFSVYELLTIDPVYNDKFTLHNGFTIYNKNVINHSDKDIQLIDYKPSLYSEFKDINFKHSLEYRYTRYGNDDYTNYFGVGENIKFNFLENYTNTANISFGFNHYLSRTIEASDYYLFKLDNKLERHFKHKINLYLNLGMENTKKTKTSTNVTEYNAYKIGLGTNASYSSYLVDLKSNLTFKNYTDENIYFLKNEKDKKIETTLSLFKKGKFFTYQTKFDLINNISNIAPYEYNKWLLSINIIKKFKGL